jgi:hypothetical protein
LIIVRSTKGHEVISALRNKDEIVLDEGFPKDIFESQSENLVLGTEARKLSRFLKLRHFVTPTFAYNNGKIAARGPSVLDSLNFNLELRLRSMIQSREYLRVRRLFVLWQLLVLGADLLRNILYKAVGKNP